MKLFVSLFLVILPILPAIASPLTVGVAGNNDQAALLLGVRPSADSRTEYRLELGFYDGIQDGMAEAIGLSASVTYDVIDANVPFDFPFGLGKTATLVRGFIGGKVGGVVNLQGPSEYDVLAAGIVGISIGDETNRVELRATPPLDPALWKKLADMDNTSVLSLALIHRFK
jgi:hypothetical protein